MGTISHFLRRVLITCIQVYRLFFSYAFGMRCRFTPSCSQYAMQAIADFGCIKGSFLMLTRLLKCHPWHAGGYDPVPCASAHPINHRR